MNLKPGTVLSNKELSQHFRVGNMGGMRRSTAYNCLVLISDPFKADYEDKWHGDILHYTGMGKKGDQDFSRQNKTLRDAKHLGIKVYLFEVEKPKEYTFKGEAELAGDIYNEIQPDEDNIPRNVLMFPLKIKKNDVNTITYDTYITKQIYLAKEARKRSFSELRKRLIYSKGLPSTCTTIVDQYYRNQDVVEFTLRKAQGICQLCRRKAPFIRPTGEPYLEVHHVIWLSRQGEDSVQNAVALCPNCHRKMHIIDDQNDITKLKNIASNNFNSLKDDYE